MVEPRMKALAEQYDFGAWQNRRTLEDNLFVWNFTLSGDEFSGWQMELVQVVPVDPATPAARQKASPLTALGPAERTHASPAAAAPQLVVSTWRRKGDAPDAIMSIAIYQASSATGARERCLHLLGEFELLQLQRNDELMAGDVAFSNPEKFVILFVRGNLVILMRNGGRQLVPLDDAARELDNLLTARQAPPLAAPGETATAATREESLIPAKGRVPGKALPIRLSQPAGLKRARFFSTGGEVAFRDGKLAYTGESEGTKRLEVHLDAENPLTVSQEFTLRPPKAPRPSGRGVRKPTAGETPDGAPANEE